MYKFCPKCGADLYDDARFCSKCGYDIAERIRQEQSAGAAGSEPEVNAPLHTAVPDVLAGQVRSAVSAPSNIMHAPSAGGELSLDIPDLTGAAGNTLLSRLPLPSIIAGLGAGGISCAALWNAEHPVVISVILSLLIVGGKIAFVVIRRRRAK